MFALCVIMGDQLTAQQYQFHEAIYPGTTNPDLGAKFGWSFDASNEWLVIGSPHYSAHDGRISIVGSDGMEHYADDLGELLHGPTSQQRFGSSIALHGNVVAVGNCSAYGSSQYCGFSDSTKWVTLFEHSETLGWQAVQVITRPANVLGDFGKAIALEEDILAIGGGKILVDDEERDVVIVFQRMGPVWSPSVFQILMGEGSVTGQSESFGHSLSMSNGRLLVGAMGDDEMDEDCGAAYIFGRPDGTEWGVLRKLLPSNGAANDRFGTAVVLNGDDALVGAPRRYSGDGQSGAAYVFNRNTGSAGNWGEDAFLIPDQGTPNMDFGAALAIQGDLLSIGAPLEDLSEPGTDGSVHVYRRTQGQWQHVQRIAPYYDGVISAVGRAGTALGFRGEELLISAPFAIVSDTASVNIPTGVVLSYLPTPVGVDETEAIALRAWPNPFSDILEMTLPDSRGSIQVLDMHGREVIQQDHTSTSGSVIKINFSALEQGTYTLRYISPAGRFGYIKVVKVDQDPIPH